MTNFQTNILKLYGNQGKTWLKALPKIVDAAATHYGLSELKPLDNLSYHYVLSGLQDHKPIILKLGLDQKSLEQETSALRAFNRFGAVRVEAFDALPVLGQTHHALLLERAVPGISLKSYFPSKEKEAIHIACAVMKRLHQAPPPKAGLFPAIQDWLAILDKPWDIPNPYLEKARRLRSQLFATSHKTVLLHGDLHHDNILKQDEEWVAIDPKGVMGEPTYEVAAFIRNPIPELVQSHHALDIIEKRMDAFSDILTLDRKRIQAWCFVQAVLAWVWSLEDGNDDGSFTKMIELFNNGV